MTEEILRVENVSKRFGGVVALDNINLSITKGETCCLVGENGSGKSTMIKIISGVYTPDDGDIYINNHHYKKLTPLQSIQEGIQVIYQDFSLFPNLTVAENISLNQQLATGKHLVSWKEMHRLAEDGLSKINISLPLDAIVSSLSTADRQLIAITKALLANASTIIMDEPTTALTQKEVTSLFRIISEIKQRGISTLFVSHKLNEVTEISDRTIIFRNGQLVMDQNARGLTVHDMEFFMTGRRLDPSTIKFAEIDVNSSELMRVENLSLANGFFDISFALKKQEILGITGLLGSGRTELAQALFGELPATSGKVFVEGVEKVIHSIQDAVTNGIAYVPDDRVREGLFLDHTITNNIVTSIIDLLTNKFHFLNLVIKAEGESWIKKLELKTPSGDLPAKSLSGGNQQRVVLAKWLASNPKILILNGPTVGVDVGSKAEIHELIRALAAQGLGILLISDDIPELMSTCHRILLMRNGRIVDEFKREGLSENLLNTKLIGAESSARTK